MEIMTRLLFVFVVCSVVHLNHAWLQIYPDLAITGHSEMSGVMGSLNVVVTNGFDCGA